MHRTRRSVLRTVSAATVATVATGTVAGQSSGNESADVVERTAIRTTAQTCQTGSTTLDEPADPIPVSDDTVRFSGSMTTPNPCHRAVIESVDREGETLVVTVGSEWPDDVEVCVMCVGHIEFEGVVELADPARVAELEVRTVDPW